MHPSAVFAGLLALVATGVKAIAVEVSIPHSECIVRTCLILVCLKFLYMQRAIFPPAATPFHLVPFFTNVPALLATCLDNSGNIALNGPSCGNFTLGNPLIGPSIPFASLQTEVGPCSVVAAPNAEGEVVSPLVCSVVNEGGRFVQVCCAYDISRNCPQEGR